MKRVSFKERPSSDENEEDMELDEGLIDMITSVGKSSRDEVKRDLVHAGIKPFDASSTRELLSRCGVEISAEPVCASDDNSHSFVHKRCTDRRIINSRGIKERFFGLLSDHSLYGRRRSDFGIRCGLVLIYPILATLFATQIFFFYGNNPAHQEIVEVEMPTLVLSNLPIADEAQIKLGPVYRDPANHFNFESIDKSDPVDTRDPVRFSAPISQVTVNDVNIPTEKHETRIEISSVDVAELTVSESHSSWGLTSVFINILSQFEVPGEIADAMFKTSASGGTNQSEGTYSVEPIAVVQWSAECFRPESTTNTTVLFGSWSAGKGQGEHANPCQWIATQLNGDVLSQSLTSRASNQESTHSYHPVAVASRTVNKKGGILGKKVRRSSVLSMPIRLGFLLPLEVKAHDTLWDIAKRITGDANNWKIIAAVNGVNPDGDTVIRRTQIIGIPLSLIKPVNDVVDQVESDEHTESIQIAVDETNKMLGQSIEDKSANIISTYTSQLDCYLQDTLSDACKNIERTSTVVGDEFDGKRDWEDLISVASSKYLLNISIASIADFGRSGVFGKISGR